MVLGPYGETGKAAATTRASGAQRSVCASGGEGWAGIAAEITPKVSSNLGQSLSQPAAASSLCTREPLGTGDADCRVGPLGLLTMTSVFCHSEERSDVGIRSFYVGRWTGVRAAEVVGPYGRSTKSQQRADVGIGPYGWLQRVAATDGAAL